jgi:hypothetical protein
MGILVVILFFTASTWMLVALIRRLWSERKSGNWRWVLFCILSMCGVAIGIWCGFFCEYKVGGSLRVISFPIPIGFFHLEDGQWVDFIVPQFQMWLALFTDVLTLTAFTTLPLWLVSRRRA